MGGDGQALLNSRKLLESLYKGNKETHVDNTASKRLNRVVRLRHCQLSHKPLVSGDKTSVCCDLGGHLYLFEAVVDYLIDRKRKEATPSITSSASGTSHQPTAAEAATTYEVGRFVKKLKDVHCLDLTATSSTKTSDSGEQLFTLTCSISGMDAAAGHPFLCNITCGHCFAASAVGRTRAEWDAVQHCPHPKCCAARLARISTDSATSAPLEDSSVKQAVWVQLLLDDEADAVSQAEMLGARLRKRTR
eukprot:CAMPEP_0176450294 /NCGR_PEP_ID=MMETSP0127-20121128/27055_1 /TAXON_ID=938130 /ORGANISM="Platyophrya macrostoma, Strain WH" /LENGTH=247 /DNA_ID=CAMNT_0017837931 /DNA_START=39 /DNA_END=779 /DNA_ORIENTATION=-